MLNRFAKCDSLESLYLAFEENTNIDYINLTNEETTTLIEVFNSNVDAREQVDDTLNEIAFDYIFNYVVDREEKDMDDIKVTNVTINKVNESEANVMEDNKVKAAVDEMMYKFQAAKESIKVTVGETYEEFIDKTDDSVNTMKEAFGNTLGVLDSVLGYSVLKDSILEMMEASMANGSSSKNLLKMAKKCRELIESEIKNLEFWGDQDSLKKAMQLKALTEDDRNKSIFESFVAGVLYIGKKVARKIRQWFNVNEEKSIINSICKGIGTFAKVLRAGAVIVWNAVKFTASLVVSGVTILVDYLARTFKTVASKIKGWASDKFNKTTEEDTVEVDDEADGVFGTNLA